MLQTWAFWRPVKTLIAPSVILAVLAGVSAAHAGTNGFYVPSFREQAGAQSGYWESFTVAIGAPGNKANFGNDTSTVVTQTQEGAMVLGSGNIYNQSLLSEFTVSYSGSGPVGKVVFQARTAGTELDYNSVSLSYGAGSLTASRTELDRVPFGVPGTPGSGSFVSSAWTWDLSPYATTSYTISFKAAEPSLSFDAATLDTQVVPEPGTWALAGLGTVALMLTGWHRTRKSAL